MDEVGVHGAIGAFLEQPPLVVEAESLEKLVKVPISVPPLDAAFYFPRCCIAELGLAWAAV